jgi:hypothetical protein
MLPFGVTFPATVPQGSEIPEGLMNNPVLKHKGDDETKGYKIPDCNKTKISILRAIVQLMHLFVKNINSNVTH